MLLTGFVVFVIFLFTPSFVVPPPFVLFFSLFSTHLNIFRSHRFLPAQIFLLSWFVPTAFFYSTHSISLLRAVFSRLIFLYVTSPL